MKISLRQTDDVEEIRELHALAFAGSPWPGDDHTFWIARDETGKAVGFCSVVYWAARACAFLSRAAVVKEASGQGLQRRMIRARLRWAKAQGIKRAITYTELRNSKSLVNLLRCGFRFYTPQLAYVGDEYHYLQLML